MGCLTGSYRDVQASHFIDGRCAGQNDASWVRRSVRRRRDDRPVDGMSHGPRMSRQLKVASVARRASYLRKLDKAHLSDGLGGMDRCDGLRDREARAGCRRCLQPGPGHQCTNSRNERISIGTAIIGPILKLYFESRIARRVWRA